MRRPHGAALAFLVLLTVSYGLPCQLLEAPRTARRSGLLDLGVRRVSLGPGAAPSAPSADLMAVGAGSREFACSLYRELVQGDGNLVFSPLSISTAMAMAYAGARGRTAEQLAEVLHFELPPERLHPAFGELSLRLKPSGPSGDDQPILRMVNGLWSLRGLRCQQSFTDTLALHYGAEPQELDFAGDPEGARRTINASVAEATGGRIAELIPASDEFAAAVLVITDAVYFRGYWRQAFLERHTCPAPFHRLHGDPVSVEMMHKTQDLEYARREGYQAVRLPYYGGPQSMVVVLPDAGSFEAVEGALTGERIADTLAGLVRTPVKLGLPKFRFARGADLAATLAAMGAPDAFDAGADFAGITGSPGLYIDRVEHKATIDVNEKATEATAGTAVVMLGIAGDDPVDFIADRPFLFLIVDEPTGALLFMGRVMDPTAAT